jgi:membrane-bound lytic murein transglycosylase MltF
LPDCGLTNRLPQDYCKHCGQSKYVKRNPVVNSLKCKLEAANHKIEEFVEAKGGD